MALWVHTELIYLREILKLSWRYLHPRGIPSLCIRGEWREEVTPAVMARLSEIILRSISSRASTTHSKCSEHGRVRCHRSSRRSRADTLRRAITTAKHVAHTFYLEDIRACLRTLHPERNQQRTLLSFSTAGKFHQRSCLARRPSST